MQLSIVLEAFFQSMDGVLSPSTVLFYRNRLPSLQAFLGDIEIDNITLDQLRAWRSGLSRRTTRWGGDSSHPVEEGALSAHTIHQYVRSCKRLFTWLVEEGTIATNPAKRLELPNLPKPYRRGIPDEARDNILASAQASSTRDYAICLILADTGCRVGGLAGLRLSDLDLDHCRAAVKEKGDKSRQVFFTPRTVEAIQAYILDRPLVQHGYLFCGRRGEPLKAGGIYELLSRLASLAGVSDGWNPHNWRHGAIRGMLRNGMSLPAVSQIAGHASVKTTGDLYGVFSEDELKEMHDKFSWVE